MKINAGAILQGDVVALRPAYEAMLSKILQKAHVVARAVEGHGDRSRGGVETAAAPFVVGLVGVDSQGEKHLGGRARGSSFDHKEHIGGITGTAREVCAIHAAGSVLRNLEGVARRPLTAGIVVVDRGCVRVSTSVPLAQVEFWCLYSVEINGEIGRGCAVVVRNQEVDVLARYDTGCRSVRLDRRHRSIPSQRFAAVRLTHGCCRAALDEAGFYCEAVTTALPPPPVPRVAEAADDF